MAAEAIEKAGGCVVGSYKEPLGGYPLLLSVLPIHAVEPTPFPRDLSDTHHKRLADVINKIGHFLDSIIAVVAPNDGFWTPNGRHRLEAMRRLGAKSITALVVADPEVSDSGTQHGKVPEPERAVFRGHPHLPWLA